MGQTALSESLRGIEAEIAARQPERALTLSQDVQARYPRALAVQRVIGEVYLALRKTREAIGALDRALAGDPEDARACCARAIVQQIQGDSMGALAWYRRACDIRPGDKVLLSAYRELARPLNQPAYTPSRTGLARLYLRGDLFAHAIREWEMVLAERPDALEAQVGLAETLWRARNAHATAERCRRLLLNAPSCVKALLMLAAIEHDAGKDDEARNQLRRAAELDPDMRIARELFADRLAANDRALSLLVFGEEPPASRVPSIPLPQQPAAALASATQGMAAGARPTAPSQPAALSQSRPLAPQMPPVTGTLPPPPTTGTLPPSPAPRMSPAAYGASAPASRPNNLPPDFHRIFSETNNMLWHDEAENQETQGRIPNMPAFDRSRTDLFARSQVVMPPPLLGASGSLEDTEARLSMNFLNWLQAQGAVAQNLGMLGAQGNTGPVPVPAPPRQRPADQPADDPRYPSSDGGMPPVASALAGGTEPLLTGPLPPPSPEALKAMFAELEPETTARRIVDADIVSARDAGDWNAQRDDPGALDGRGGERMASAPIGDAAAADPMSAWTETDAEPSGWAGGIFPPAASSRLDETSAAFMPTGALEDMATGEFPVTPASASASYAQSAQPFPLAGEIHSSEPEDEASWRMPATGGQTGAAEEVAGQNGTPDRFDWAAFANPAESATADDHLYSAVSGFASTHDEIPAESATVHDSPTASADGMVSSSDTPLTLEALEQGFTESGFASYELRPGELAAIVGQMPATTPDEQPPAAVWIGDAANPAEAQPVPPTAPPEPEPTRKTAAPAPDDYAGRLSLARERRSAGNLDDALGEYRIILKNAPDLLGDVMDELNESLAAAPDHPEVHRLLGDAHIRQGDYLSALESYNRAVALTQAQAN